MLRELAELGMQLARAAAQQAMAAWSPAPEGGVAPAVGPVEGPRPDSPADPRRVHSHCPDPRFDPGLTFARLSRAVRQTIALEARIAAGDFAPRAGRAANRRPVIDPDLRVVRQVLRAAAAEAETDGRAREALFRDIDDRLAELPDIDPDGELPVDEIIANICTDLGLHLDPSRLPDAALDALCGAAARAAPHADELRADDASGVAAPRGHFPPPPLGGHGAAPPVGGGGPDPPACRSG